MPTRPKDTAWWRWAPGRIHGPAHTRTSRYLTMRDGVDIAVDVFLPRDLRPDDRLTSILCQTRYHRRPAYRRPFSLLLELDDPFAATRRRMASLGYAFVVVDVRGSGASYGSRAMEWSPDEVTDGTEIVDWISKQPWSDGAVGLTGISYVGTAAEMLVARAHPAVKAAHIRFAPFDVYADITNPGGICNLRFLERWSALNDALDRDDPGAVGSGLSGVLMRLAVRGVAPVDADPDRRRVREAMREHRANYDILAAATSIEFRDDLGPGGVAFDDFSPHAFVPELERSGAAVCSLSGYFDGANTLSAVKRFLNVRTPGARLVLGPWDHGAFQNPDPFGPSRRVGFDSFGDVLRYFEYHVRGAANGLEAEAPVHYFTMGEEAWRSADTWPPPGFEPMPLYMGEGGRLGPAPPEGDDGADAYRVDPSASSGPGSRWMSLINAAEVRIDYPDRRVQDHKLLVYQTEPLERALELTGHPVITLYLRSTADDGQLFVYLEDVCSQGEVRYVTEGLCRPIHRVVADAQPLYRMPRGIPHRTYRRADAQPLVPGRVEEVAFDLLPVSHLFGRGHAIRIAIAGADRDNFGPLPHEPPRLDVMRSRKYPSHVSLPVRFR